MRKLTLSWCFTLEIPTISGFFSSDIRLTLNRSIFNRVRIFALFVFHRAQWVGEKGSEATGRGFKPLYRL